MLLWSQTAFELLSSCVFLQIGRGKEEEIKMYVSLKASSAGRKAQVGGSELELKIIPLSLSLFLPPSFLLPSLVLSIFPSFPHWALCTSTVLSAGEYNVEWDRLSFQLPGACASESFIKNDRSSILGGGSSQSDLGFHFYKVKKAQSAPTSQNPKTCSLIPSPLTQDEICYLYVHFE